MSSDNTVVAMPKRRYEDETETSNQSSLPSINARVGAFLLDYILLLFPLAVTLVLSFYVKRRLMEPAVADFFQYVGYALVISVMIANWVYGYVHYGQSFGKRFIGLRVVRLDGQPINYQTALLRLFGYWLSLLFFGLGLLWLLWDNRHRGWHDMIAKTIVIRD